MNQLDALKQFTTVVADTGDFHQIAQYQPTDATTNPSLIFKAVQMPGYKKLLDETLSQHPMAAFDEIMDRLLVCFGCEILSLLPGRVSTEVMGASFRNIGQISALSGCDLLTIAPDLLAQLQAQTLALSPALSIELSRKSPIERVSLNEVQFRFALNEDAMARDKFAEGIRAFWADARKLDALMQA